MLLLVFSQFSLAQTIDPPDFFGDDPDHTLLYIQNGGQVFDQNNDPVPEIEFYTQGTSPRLYLQTHKISFVLENLSGHAEVDDKMHRVDLSFTGETGLNGASGSEQSDVLFNFYNAVTPSGGAEGLHGYQRITYPAIYPGIDLQLYSSLAGPKTYLIIQPQADPSVIGLNFFGQDNLTLNNQGDLELLMDQETLVIKQFLAYQVDQNNQITPLTWQPQFVNQGGGTVSLNLGSYDPSQYLVLLGGAPAGARGGTMQGNGWSTYFGGAGSDYGNDITVDEGGDVFVTGTTFSSVFPGVGTSTGQYLGNGDVFIDAFGQDRELRWITYLGGTGNDDGQGVAWTSIGGNSLYVVGETNSGDFYLQQDGGYFESQILNTVAFITELDSDFGTVDWSTFFGAKDTKATDVALDVLGNLFVVGNTRNQDVAQTSCAPPNLLNGFGFPTCSSFSPSAYFQNFNAWGNGQQLNTQDGFIARFATNHNLTYSTFFGGDNFDAINGIAIDETNEAFYIVGTTNSEAAPSGQNPNYCIVPQNGEFPLCDGNGAGHYFRVANNWGGQLDQTMTDAFVAKFDLYGAEAGKIRWNTYFGSGTPNPPNDQGGNDGGTGIAVTSIGEVIIAGWTDMPHLNGNGICDVSTTYGFPICTTATTEYYQDFGGGVYDNFVARFGWDQGMHKLDFSAWVGGEGDEYRSLSDLGWPDQGPSVAVNTNDVVILHGTSYSPSNSGAASFPVQWSASMFQQDENEDAAQNNFGGSDGYVMGLDANNELVYSTYYGGAGTSTGSGTVLSGDWAGGVATYQDKEIFITGGTYSFDEFVLGCPVPTSSWCKDNTGTQTIADANKSAAYIAQLNEAGWIVSAPELEAMTDGQIRVYPNPTIDQFTVEVGQELLGNAVPEITVLDIQGRILTRLTPEISRTPNFSNFTAVLNVDPFPPGVFIVKISTDTSVYSTKLIKR